MASTDNDSCGNDDALCVLFGVLTSAASPPDDGVAVVVVAPTSDGTAAAALSRFCPA